MASDGSLNADLSKKTLFLGLRLWVLIGIFVAAFIVVILIILTIWVTCGRKSRNSFDKFSLTQIPNVPKDIAVDKVGGSQSSIGHPDSVSLSIHDKSNEKNTEKILNHWDASKSTDPDNASQCSSIYHHERTYSSHSVEEGSSGTFLKPPPMSYAGHVTASPLVGLPEASHLGWGHWFTLRDLQLATNRFSAENVLGEGGYGVVYRGRLINGTEVAVKRLLNNL